MQSKIWGGLCYQEIFDPESYQNFLFSEQCVVPPRRVLVHTNTEAESKEKQGVCDPMPELTVTSPYVHSRVDSNTFTMNNPIGVDLNPMPESTFYPQSRTL
jgi:hypothetical protein